MTQNWGRSRQTGNNGGMLSNNQGRGGPRILNISAGKRRDMTMKHILYAFLTALMIALALPAQAAGCYADYKAKQDNPLRLHYGVAQINGPCDAASAAAELSPRLAAQGWTLLNILSVFGDEGLATRKDSAGPHYLRF